MLFFLKANSFWMGWVCFFGLGFVWFCRSLSRKKAQIAASTYSMADLSKATIFDATPGDIIILTGYGDGFDDVHLTVKSHNGYRLENGFVWDEVICEHKGRELCIEAENDDGDIFITATSEERRVFMEQVLTPDQMSISKKDLDRYLKEDSDKNYISFRGKEFYYDEAKECLYMPNKIEDDGELFFYWDFEDEEEREILSIERWENGEMEIFRGTILHPDFVSLLKAK